MIIGTIHPKRLRSSVAIVAVLLALAVWSLWPSAKHSLVLYAAGEGAVRVADAFTRETGIPVAVIRLSTGPMLARIAAEGERPGWTVAWVDGDISAAALDRAGLLEQGVVPAARWTAMARALLPADGGWIPTGITLAGVSLCHDGNHGVREGMPDPALSGTAYPQLAGVVSISGGWPKAKGAILDWKRRGLEVVPTSAAVISELDAGRIGRARIQSSTAFNLTTHRTGYRVSVPDPAFVLPGVLMVAKGLKPKPRRNVDRFVDFVLSAKGQRVRLESNSVDSFYWPVTNDVLPSRALPDLKTLALRHVDPYKWAPLQADITSWFETRVAER